jgi:DNA-binding response OmpR family regulator
MVLLVDDDAAIRGMITAVLRRDGITCDEAENGDEAIRKLRRGHYRSVLLDLMLPECNGFEVLRFLKAEKPSMLRRVIVLTAASEATLRHFHDQQEVFDLLRKPFDIESLREKVSACRRQQLEQ